MPDDIQANPSKSAEFTPDGTEDQKAAEAALEAAMRGVNPYQTEGLPGSIEGGLEPQEEGDESVEELAAEAGEDEEGEGEEETEQPEERYLPTPEELRPEDEQLAGWYAEIAEGGELSEESRTAALEWVKEDPERALQQYLNLVTKSTGALEEINESRTQQFHQSILDIAGGEDGYKKMMAWGKKNLSKADQSRFNSAFDAGGETARLAVENLHQRMQLADGRRGKRTVKGKPAQTTEQVATYADREEWSQSVDWYRYQNEAKYRAQKQKELLALG